MTPSDPDTICTAMLEAVKQTKQTDQSYTVFTADLALYKVSLNILWAEPILFPKFVLRFGGMHTLMNLAGAVGNLLADSGLEDIMKSAFGGVSHMLSGKKFPQNIRALRMVAEEMLRSFLEQDEENIQTLGELIAKLEGKALQSRTSKLWLDSLIKPVLIMML